MRKLFSAKKGFTLIELMIVIAIIAILAAILIPNFIRARGSSQLAACESNEKNMATSLEMYSTDNNGNYPKSSGTTISAASKFSPNYMRQVPNCPSNGIAYTYVASNSNTVPITDYGIIQGGGNAHSYFVGTGAVVDPSWDSTCTTSTYPCYYGSMGIEVGK